MDTDAEQIQSGGQSARRDLPSGQLHAISSEVMRRVWTSGFRLDQIAAAPPTFDGGWRDVPASSERAIRLRLSQGRPLTPRLSLDRLLRESLVEGLAASTIVSLAVAVIVTVETVVSAATCSILMAVACGVAVKRIWRVQQGYLRHVRPGDYPAGDYRALRSTWITARTWEGAPERPENRLAGIGFCAIRECVDGASASTSTWPVTLTPAAEIHLMDLWGDAACARDRIVGGTRSADYRAAIGAMLAFVDDLIDLVRARRAVDAWARCPADESDSRCSPPPCEVTEALEVSAGGLPDVMRLRLDRFEAQLATHC